MSATQTICFQSSMEEDKKEVTDLGRCLTTGCLVGIMSQLQRKCRKI